VFTGRKSTAMGMADKRALKVSDMNCESESGLLETDIIYNATIARSITEFEPFRG
jgi:hypothetical protein